MRRLYEYGSITLGVFLMSFGINMFYSQHQMVTGGVTGLSIVLNTVFSVPIWLSNILLNLPLFILGIKIKGRDFLIRTLYATVMLSVGLYLTEFIPVFETDLTLAAIFGGAFGGIGIGLVFRAMATTGGSDLAASLINSRFGHISVSRIMFIIDAFVILIGLFVFGPLRTLYSIVAVFVCSRFIDALLEGLNFAKAAFIISDNSIEISKRLLSDMNRGVTSLSGKGMYTGQDKNVVFCVVSKKQIVTLKNIVKDVDKNAFVIVADVREVVGNGFSN